MANTLRMRALNGAIEPSCKFEFARSPTTTRQPVSVSIPSRGTSIRVVKSLKNTAASEYQPASLLSSSVGSPPLTSLHLSHWTLSNRHVAALNVIACAAAVSATWLLCSAIPTLLAFKRAAESMEKLLDVTREELPDTMAAIRLSGMEISDLTMELSDLGQEITKGVRSSTQAVRIAEERLRGLSNMNSTVPVQVVVTNPKTQMGEEPVLARTARSVREGIVKGRTTLQMVFALFGVSKLLMSFIAKRDRR